MMDIVSSDTRQASYLRMVSLRLPYACRQGMTEPDATPDCLSCWQSILDGFRPNEDEATGAVRGTLDRLAGQDCTGAAQLRRAEALRLLDDTVRAWWQRG